MKKERIDVLLIERGFASSRERAKRLLMAGSVLVDQVKIEKAGTTVDPAAQIRVLGSDIPYVSRGGLKLAKAISFFHMDLSGKHAADIGASTGGFTDCMLQNGVTRVYAIDVGYGQLAWKLRQDERVTNMERTNIRNVTPEQIGELLDFASIDVAFISLAKVLPVAYSLLKENGELIALIKPQFEAGKERVGKKGVVREAAVHIEVTQNVLSFAQEIGFSVAGLTYSPVKGPEGNIEYLTRLAREKKEHEKLTRDFIVQVVEEAHAELDR